MAWIYHAKPLVKVWLHQNFQQEEWEYATDLIWHFKLTCLEGMSGLWHWWSNFNHTNLEILPTIEISWLLVRPSALIDSLVQEEIRLNLSYLLKFLWIQIMLILVAPSQRGGLMIKITYPKMIKNNSPNRQNSLLSHWP